MQTTSDTTFFIQQMVEVIEEMGEDQGISYYGKYEGRGFHKGYAFLIDNLGTALKVIVATAAKLAVTDHPSHPNATEEFAEFVSDPHMDSMGRDNQIISFSDR